MTPRRPASNFAYTRWALSAVEFCLKIKNQLAGLYPVISTLVAFEGNNYTTGATSYLGTTVVTISPQQGGEEIATGRHVAGDVMKAFDLRSKEGPRNIASMAILGGICVSILLLAATMLPGGTGGGATAILLELNDKFDRVWCPLPTWAQIVLVIAAWTLFFRVGKDFLKTVRRQHGNQ